MLKNRNKQKIQRNFKLPEALQKLQSKIRNKSKKWSGILHKYPIERLTTKQRLFLVKTLMLIAYHRSYLFRKRNKKENRALYNKLKKIFYNKVQNFPSGLGMEELIKKIFAGYTLKPIRDRILTKLDNETLTVVQKKLLNPTVEGSLKGKRWKTKKWLPITARNKKAIRIAKLWTSIDENKAKKFWTRLTLLRTMGKGKNKYLAVNYRYHYLMVLQTTKRSHISLLQKFKITQRKLKLNATNKNKYVELKQLRQNLFSKISPSVYKRRHISSKRKGWLSRKYIWLRFKSARKKKYKIDFLKTTIGTQFLGAHKASIYTFNRAKRYITKITDGALATWARRSTKKTWAKKFKRDQQRAWYYTNIVIPKRMPRHFTKESIRRISPHHQFLGPYFRRGYYPWRVPLLATRALYKGFHTRDRRVLKTTRAYTWIPYFRKRRPVHTKKNKLYRHRERLLQDWDGTTLIRQKKKARIKQVLQKTTLPFYGHLRPKQFARITEKTRTKKSTLLSREEFQLSSLESRLDVVVYRLNLAPTFFWARKLIQDGSIFVCSGKRDNSKEFEKLYAHYKHNAYPLKLRDPLSLYKKTPWNTTITLNSKLFDDKDNDYPKISTKLKFLLEPMRNINYLTSPGDVILCAPGALQNKYKSNKALWKKPIPTNLLSYSAITESKNNFVGRFNKLKRISRTTEDTMNVGVVIFSPTFNDLPKHDRIQRSFLRWMSL